MRAPELRRCYERDLNGSAHRLDLTAKLPFRLTLRRGNPLRKRAASGIEAAGALGPLTAAKGVLRDFPALRPIVGSGERAK